MAPLRLTVPPGKNNQPHFIDEEIYKIYGWSSQRLRQFKTKSLLFLHYASPDYSENISEPILRPNSQLVLFPKDSRKGMFQEQKKEGSLKAPREELKSPRKQDFPMLEKWEKSPLLLRHPTSPGLPCSNAPPETAQAHRNNTKTKAMRKQIKTLYRKCSLQVGGPVLGGPGLSGCSG